ncbi:hypothetical protein ABZ401_19260 [Streptomyces sp. NPDC005892]|uniref:hypothetical protein n=1 Tax=Streptomyces sp. NPDC005892 TaxID=3155593 RepID=UPI0034087B16
MNAMDLYVVAYVVAGPVAVETDHAHLAAVDAAEAVVKAATATLAAKVRHALGWRDTRILDGETATSLSFWSQHELNAVYERVGGVVTSRTVHRAYDGEATVDTEITVTITLPGVGTVQLTTDWDEDSGGHDLPVMRAITAFAV